MIHRRRHRVPVIIQEPRESEDKAQLVKADVVCDDVPVDLFEWRRGLNLHRELLVAAAPAADPHGVTSDHCVAI